MTGLLRPTAAIAACLLAIAGCARHGDPAGAAPAASQQGLRLGTIAAMRPAGLMLPVAARTDMRGSILRAIGPAAGAQRPPDSGAPTEFIVRTDAGDTLSIVQGDAGGLHPGERVAVTGTAPMRLARASAVPGGNG